MKSSLWFRFASGAILLLSLRVNAAQADRSVSTSRQFIVYGGDVRLRGVICDLAEQARTALRRRTDSADDWKIPIIVNAERAQADAPEKPQARLDISQTGAGLKLQLDVTLGGRLNGSALQEEVLRAAIVELMYRSRADLGVGSTYALPPAWLVQGIAALELQHEALADYEHLSRTKIGSLTEFLQQKPELLDDASRRLYRTAAAALVQSITSSHDDRLRLGRFIRDLPEAAGDPLPDFVAHFPALAEPQAWQDALARLTDRQPPGSLTFSETDRELDALLAIKLRVPPETEKTCSFAEAAKLRVTPQIARALEERSRDLLRLELRADLVHRAIVHEYGEIALFLAHGKAKQIAKRLTRVDGSRAELRQRFTGINDYMNWYEATQLETPSGLFDGHPNAARPPGLEQRRHDPISVYLDTLESQLGD